MEDIINIILKEWIKWARDNGEEVEQCLLKVRCRHWFASCSRKSISISGGENHEEIREETLVDSMVNSNI